MDIRLSNPLKIVSCIVLVTLSTAVNLLPTRQSLAQSADDLRFGLVNAFDAPEAASESGASWELVHFRWDELQPDAPSQWDTTYATEDWLDEARAAGREVVGVLVGTPGWATDGRPGVGVPRGLYLPVDDPNNLWAGFVRQAVSYYAARGINHWVIWEDPDIPPGAPGYQWEGTIDDYYQLVKAAYLVAKGTNPEAVIHLGGVSYYDLAWFGHFLDLIVDDSTAFASNYYFDVATVHLYDSPERIYTLTRSHYNLMEQRGITAKPVWINETNARPAVDPDVYPPDIAFDQHPNITLEQQAAFIIQVYAIGFAADAERIAVYRLMDNLPMDGQQAFGLLRGDGTPRPAYDAYQLMVQELSGAVYARRLAEQTYPLIDCVRLTFESKVTYIAWARTEKTATLFVPARSDEATLVDLDGNRMAIAPQNGEYYVAVGGADCDDPVEGCMIGGEPRLLVEENLADPLNETPPLVRVEEGGVVLTPDPGIALTETAQAAPTLTPTPLPSPTSLPPVEETPTPAASSEAPVEAPTEVAEANPPANSGGVIIDYEALKPRGLAAILPYALMGLGGLIIVGGVAFFLVGLRKPSAEIVGEEVAVEGHEQAESDDTEQSSPPEAGEESPGEDQGE